MLKVGLLGAARIAPGAMVVPAQAVARVEVIGVAARDPQRAKEFAAEHGLSTFWESYEALIASEDINAVYIGLPPSAHHEWTLKALAAGKHVLCEKPFCVSTEQAIEMVDAGERSGLVLGEAFHWRYHPLARRVKDLLDSGVVGEVSHVDAEFSVTISDTSDIRYSLALGGGALMDLGCYAVQWARFAGVGEPTVVSAECVEAQGCPGIDVSTTIQLAYPNGATGEVRCSMKHKGFIAMLTVTGDMGTLEVRNPLAPSMGNAIVITTTSGESSSEEVEQGKSTYHHQLEAFAAAVLDGAPFVTSGEDSIATMRIIEDSYAAAGFPPRKA